MIAGYCGESEDFQDAMYSFARSYSAQNETDYEAFKKAVKKGILKTASKKPAL